MRDQIYYEGAKLERFTKALVIEISREFAETLCVPEDNVNISVSHHARFDRDTIGIKVMARMFGESLLSGDDAIEYPANWIEALKERFAPEWLKRRWPVRYERWEAVALYPSLSLPDEKHVIQLKTCDGMGQARRNEQL